VILTPEKEDHKEAPVKSWRLWEVKRYMEIKAIKATYGILESLLPTLVGVWAWL
jgi:hypothetical protein